MGNEQSHEHRPCGLTGELRPEQLLPLPPLGQKASRKILFGPLGDGGFHAGQGRAGDAIPLQRLNEATADACGCRPPWPRAIGRSEALGLPAIRDLSDSDRRTIRESRRFCAKKGQDKIIRNG